MKLLGSKLSWLFQVLIRRWFLLFTLFALYYYHLILDKDQLCSCTSLDLDCWVYLVVPAVVLFLVQLWVDLVFSRGLGLLCGRGWARVAPVLLRRVLGAGFVGLLWVESVLLDGDWYLCCGGLFDRGSSSCFKPGDFLFPDVRMKNESQVIGLLMVVLVTLMAAILSCVPFGKCCSCDWTEAVMEEAGLELSLRMRMAARDKLKAKLNQSEAYWRMWEGLERELLLDTKPDPAPKPAPNPLPNPAANPVPNPAANPVQIPRVRDTVHVNPIALRPISREDSNMDWGRARPGLNQDQGPYNQWRH